MRPILALYLVPLAIALWGSFSYRNLGPKQIVPEPADWERMAAWLPVDTETYIVTTQPDTIRKLFDLGETASLADSMKLISLTAYPNKLLEALSGTRFEMSVAGRRNFQAPEGLGIGQHDGCEIFKLNSDQATALQAQIEQISSTKENIEGLSVTVYENDGRSWFIGLEDDLLFVATDRDYLSGVLQRRGASDTALDRSGELWQHADTSAPMFAVRTFSEDLRDSEALNFSDENIVGYAMTLDESSNELRIVSVSESPEGFARAGVWGKFFDQEHWSGMYSLARIDDRATMITLGATADGSMPSLLISIALGHVIFI